MQKKVTNDWLRRRKQHHNVRGFVSLLWALVSVFVSIYCVYAFFVHGVGFTEKMLWVAASLGAAAYSEVAGRRFVDSLREVMTVKLIEASREKLNNRG